MDSEGIQTYDPAPMASQMDTKNLQPQTTQVTSTPSLTKTVMQNVVQKRIAAVLDDTRPVKKPQVRHCGKCGSNSCNS